MKINPKPVLHKRKGKALSSRSRLPGEPRPFTPLTKATKATLVNSTPPQHLDPSGVITSTRTQEVGRSTTDPWVQRIHELEAQVQALEAELHKRAELCSVPPIDEQES